jgi:hypothetical protein
MKYSISARQDPEYLEKADEIKFQYRDIAAIMDYAEKFPNAVFVVEILPNQEWEFEKIKEAYILSKQKLTVCVPTLNDKKVERLAEAGIPFYWGYPITTEWELAAIMNTEVSQIKIEAPLFFKQDLLRPITNKEIRVSANIAHQGYLPFTGVNGSWIRPEDVDKYEDTITIIEFEDCDKKKEQALYRIYAEQHEWPGNISMIISNLENDCVNRMLPPEFTISRLNCGQRCINGSCRLCYRYFSLADPKLLKDYLARVEKDI